ncbi:MAG: FAD-dependent oxidoreductase [Xylophilus ampelinus]
MGGRNVAVVGGGVVGTAIALWLRRRGMDVVLVDRDRPGSGCSSGNSGALSPGSVAPLAMPGVIASVPRMLLDPESPLHLPLGYLPRAAPWLAKFVLSARPAQVARAAARLDALHRGAIAMHRRLTREIGVPELFMQRGHLHLYPDEAALAKDRAGWALREAYGYSAEKLGRDGILALEPRIPEGYRIGMHLGDHATILQPRRYVEAMADAFAAAGGEYERAEVGALDRTDAGWRLRGARDRTFDQVVVAAGAWSRTLLKPFGVRLALESQRGYHVQFDGGRDVVGRTVVLADRKVFITPMEHGLRIGGTVEIAGLRRAPDERRAQALERIARESFPDLASCPSRTWMGHRPCMPDSVPSIGQAPGHPGLWMAVGHGHLGLTDSLPTAEWIAQGVADSAWGDGTG